MSKGTAHDLPGGLGGMVRVILVQSSLPESKTETKVHMTLNVQLLV